MENKRIVKVALKIRERQVLDIIRKAENGISYLGIEDRSPVMGSDLDYALIRCIRAGRVEVKNELIDGQPFVRYFYFWGDELSPLQKAQIKFIESQIDNPDLKRITSWRMFKHRVYSTKTTGELKEFIKKFKAKK